MNYGAMHVHAAEIQIKVAKILQELVESEPKAYPKHKKLTI